MTDKERILHEIERLKSQLVRGACASQIAMETHCKEEAYNEVLALIDYLPDETASPELEEELVNYFGAMPDDKDKIALARHFAEWQKKQDHELLTIAHFDGVASGREAERKELLEWAKQEQYESTTIVADDFWQKVIDKLQH